MDYKQHYDRNIVLPRGSFIAYMFYVSADKELNIVLRKGRQYRFKINNGIMNSILKQNNRGSYISKTLVHSKKHNAEFVQIVPNARIEEITLPTAHQRWLAR